MSLVFFGKAPSKEHGVLVEAVKWRSTHYNDFLSFASLPYKSITCNINIFSLLDFPNWCKFKKVRAIFEELYFQWLAK